MTYIKIHIKIQTIIFSFILPLLPIYYKNSMHLDTNLSTTIDTCWPTSDHDQHFLFPNSGKITEKAENSREYRLRCTRWYNPFGRFVVQQVIRFVRSPSCSIPAGNRERFVLEPRLSERVAGMMRREQTRKNHVDETRSRDVWTGSGEELDNTDGSTRNLSNRASVSVRKRVVQSIERIELIATISRWVNIENVGWKRAWDETFSFYSSTMNGNTLRDSGIDGIISIFSPRNWHKSLETDSKSLIIQVGRRGKKKGEQSWLK